MTSWVSIDREKCTDCGICVLRCARCFGKRDDEIIVQADENCCNLCGHCVALCPGEAVVHHKMDSSNFIQIDDAVTFETDSFIRFIRERRSHRHFKDKKIPREDIEKLIDTCRYTPTGSNVQTVEIIVVQNPEKRQKLSDLAVDFFDDIGGRAEKKSKKLRAEGKETPEYRETLQRTVQYRERLLLARNMGYDPIFHKAPAVIIFHSPVQTSTPKDNCVIASTTMGLTARTMGLETTYIGLFEMASKTYQPLIEELGLPPGHEVFSVLIMGYPKLTFLKTVDRKPIRTRWE
ncbi:MAG: nitroreductase family protein [Candidatus Hydrogenedentota bacterium]|nr:MAG: nitroreductase family protein [Candidatus Hydrogenedentota bacterium]